MKNLLKWALPCLCLMAFVAACGDSDNDGGKPGTELTPDENKQKLDEIGQSLVSKINPKDHETLIKVADYFSSIVGDVEMVEPDMNYPSSVMKNISRICAKSDLGRMVEFASISSDIYKLSDYYGIYTYNTLTEEWEETASTSTLEYRFKYDNKDAVIKVSASGKEENVDLENGNQVSIPAKVEAVVTLATTELCKLTVNSELSTAQHTAKITASLSANGYVFETVADVSGSKAIANFTMKKNNEVLISAKAEVAGKNMTNPSESDLDEPQNMFNKAWSKVDIMNQLNFYVECSNIKDFANALDNVDHSKDYVGQKYDNEQSAKKEAEVYNKYMTGQMRYAGSDDVVASFAFQAYLGYSYQSQNYSTKEWYIEPVIVFAIDDSRYSFEDYFDETSFSALISSLEKLADDYDAIIGW